MNWEKGNLSARESFSCFVRVVLRNRRTREFFSHADIEKLSLLNLPRRGGSTGGGGEYVYKGHSY